MVACAFGATRDPAKPKYVRVTEADIERWYPGAGGIFYLWMRPYVGRIYDVDALAVLNPDVPNTSGWIEFLTDALRVWGLTGTTTLSSVADNQVAYNVFRDNCVCNLSGPPVETTCEDTGASGVPLGTAGSYVVYTANKLPNMTHYRSWVGGQGAGGYTARADVQEIDSHGVLAPLTTRSSNWAQGVDSNATLVAPTAGYDQLRLTIFYLTGDWNGRSYAWHRVQLCTPTSAGQPALPPAPSYVNLPAYTAPAGTTNDQLEVKLDALVNMVASMTDWTKATQRQSVPFAYIPGAAHAGLTGHGQIAVAGLLGLAVTFTTIPARLPVDTGTPDQIWQLGRISLGTADGWQRNITLTHSPALVVPVSAFVTKVGYTLPVGVTATITELKAEA